MHTRAHGFTIVEMAIVIAVISVITTITVVAFNQAQRGARDDRITADITSLKRAIQSYSNDNGSYPTCPSGTTCAVSTISTSLQKYLNTVPVANPAGRNYQYANTGQPDNYALEVFYYADASCKTGVAMTQTWFSSLADCQSLYPNRL